MSGDAGGGLFSNLKYFTTGAVSEECHNILNNGGGVKRSILSTLVTHLIVGEDGDTDIINEATEMLCIPAVKEDWVSASHHVGTLLPLQPFTAGTDQLFTGVLVSVHPSLSSQDRDRLWAMVTWHGGRVVSGHLTGVTHIVTGCPSHPMVSGVSVVTPDWVVDSVKSGKVMNVEEYQVEIASEDVICEQTSKQETKIDDTEDKYVDNEDKTDKLFEVNEETETLKPVTEPVTTVTEPVTVENFAKKQSELLKKYLSKLPKEEQVQFYQLSTSDQRQFVIQAGLIIRVIGNTVELTDFQASILEADIVMTTPAASQHIDNDKELEISSSPSNSESTEVKPEQNVEALEPERAIELSSPLEATPVKTSIDSPPSKESSEDDNDDDNRSMARLDTLNSTPSSKQKSGLTEEERKALSKMNRIQRQLYLQKLGPGLDTIAVPSTPMTPVTPTRAKVLTKADSRLNSPNVATPQRIQVTTTPSSVSSPSSSSSSSRKIPGKICLLGCTFVITGYDESGQVGNWSSVIRRHGGVVVTDMTQAGVTHVIAPSMVSDSVRGALARGARVVTSHWLNDVIILKKMVPPWKNVHFPLPATRVSNISWMKLTVTGFEGPDRDYVKDLIAMSGATYTPALTKDNDVIICKQATGEKYMRAVQWNIPVVNIKWLNDVMFASENISNKMKEPKYKQFRPDKEGMRISRDLVKDLLEPWKDSVVITKDIYYKYKERIVAETGKRPSEPDPTFGTPERKRLKMDPRSLFVKETPKLTESSHEEEDEVNFGFYEQNSRAKLFSGQSFFICPDVKPGVNILKNLIEECGGSIVDEIQSSDNRLRVISDKDEPPGENVQVVTSDYILSAISSTK